MNSRTMRGDGFALPRNAPVLPSSKTASPAPTALSPCGAGKSFGKAVAENIGGKEEGGMREMVKFGLGRQFSTADKRFGAANKRLEMTNKRFEDRHESTKAYIDTMRPRCVELARVLKKTGSFYYHCDEIARLVS